MEKMRDAFRRGWVLAVLVCPTVTLGQVAYQQLPSENGQGVRSDGEIANPGFFQRVADDFVLSTSASITGVDWWGGSENFSFQNLSNISGVTISFYNNGPNNIPVEPPMFTQTIPKAALTVTPTCGDFILGGYEFRMSAELSAPVSLPAGPKYWIHIGAILVSFNLDAMLWSESNAGNDLYSADSAPNDGVWQGPIASPLGDFAFRLRTSGAPACDAKDANCDSSFNVADVNAFVNAALSAPGTQCSPCAGDVNNDGVTNGKDVQAFVCAVFRTP